MVTKVWHFRLDSVENTGIHGSCQNQKHHIKKNNKSFVFIQHNSNKAIHKKLSHVKQRSIDCNDSFEDKVNKNLRSLFKIKVSTYFIEKNHK